MNIFWALLLALLHLCTSTPTTNKGEVLSTLTQELSGKNWKVDKDWQDKLGKAIDTLKTAQATKEVDDFEAQVKVYKPVDTKAPGYKLPIVYVYTVSKTFCEYGMPQYIKYSLQQALMTQHDADVILVANYAECPLLKTHADQLEGIVQMDTKDLQSNRLRLFHNRSTEIFQDDGAGNNLWVTSALRFFLLENMMIKKSMGEVMHIEADNMLYGSYTEIIDVFRKGYHKLAATPLNTNKTFMTASVLWIADLDAIRHFNDFLLALAMNTMTGIKLPQEWMDKLTEIKIADKYSDFKGKPKAMWNLYLHWIRPYACCKRNGVQQDADFKGIKRFAINEMSLMGFYHKIIPDRFQLLPVVPEYPYIANRHTINISEFGPRGRESGPNTHWGIWDPNSWGQFLGGTSSKGGRDKGFTDSSHVPGLAIRMGHCRPHMKCGKPTIHRLPKSLIVASNGTSPALECYTVPMVRCGATDDELPSAANDTKKKEVDWTHLYNLHVHSKHTENYISQPCECGV